MPSSMSFSRSSTSLSSSSDSAGLANAGDRCAETWPISDSPSDPASVIMGVLAEDMVLWRVCDVLRSFSFGSEDSSRYSGCMRISSISSVTIRPFGLFSSTIQSQKSTSSSSIATHRTQSQPPSTRQELSSHERKRTDVFDGAALHDLHQVFFHTRDVVFLATEHELMPWSATLQAKPTGKGVYRLVFSYLRLTTFVFGGVMPCGSSSCCSIACFSSSLSATTKIWRSSRA